MKPFLTPAQTALVGLLALIALGTVLLALPACHSQTGRVGLFEAFFTATSAVCVTGLVVVDTGRDFSPLGTAVILALFQLGGLGMLLWSSTIVLLLGGQLGLRQRLLMVDQLPGLSISGAARLTLRVAQFMIGVELVGALVLWLCWRDRIPGLEGFYYAFFHSASALCNAGFALWPDSLARDAAHPLVNGTIIALVFVGGLGYAVLRDTMFFVTGRSRRMSVHTRLVLSASALLVLGGAALFLLFESAGGGLLAPRPWDERLLISLFQSTCRTAGLSTVDVSQLRPETLELTMVLMFIGGSPGSTAGGLKTTTMAILLLAAWSQIRGREDVELFSRRLSPTLVFQALAVTVCACLCVLTFALILNVVEPIPFSDVLFETISALAIVGLSTGVTPELTTFSKLLLCVAMVVGRMGPLSLASSLLRHRRRTPVRHPVEDVWIG